MRVNSASLSVRPAMSAGSFRPQVLLVAQTHAGARRRGRGSGRRLLHHPPPGEALLVGVEVDIALDVLQELIDLVNRRGGFIAQRGENLLILLLVLFAEHATFQRL